jgi:hypothetical protein
MPSTRRRRSPSAAACPPSRSSGSRSRWRRSRSSRRSSCRSPGPTPGAREHDKVVGRPVAMYAMRGVSAHSNGFQTCRALHLIQMLLGALDGPGNFRSRAPFPKPVPPPQLPENDAARLAAPDTPAAHAARLPDPARGPRDRRRGPPLRIDKAYSWESPIAAHGMMHMVIRNAVEADPYPIDTLMLFMANMAWNSSMNTARHAGHAVREGRGRRVPDPVRRGGRRVRLRDGALRRPGAARHHLSRALRRDLDARPADLRARRGRRRDPPPAGRAGPRRAALAGRAGGSRRAAAVPGLRRCRGRRVRRLRGLHRALRARARHRLPGRLARRRRRAR